MFLHDVKIGTKLFLAFGFFIVLMVISASLSLLSLNRANNGMQSIITRDYPTTVKANQLIDNFQEFISTQQLMLLDERGTYTGQSQQRLKEISEHITVILGELNNALQDQKSQQVLAEIRSVRQQYLDSRYRILQAVQNNNREGAIQEMMTTTLAVQQAYKAKVKELIAIQNSEMQSAGAQVEGDFRSSRLLLILITLFSVAAGSLIGWLIVRAITRPLGEAVNFAKAISEGDLTGSITPHGKDETGLLLHALMEMKSRLLDIVQQVQTGSENISSAAAQIVAGNQDLAARTEEQASSVEQTAASMEQITATVKNTAAHTGEATNLSADAATVVKNNGEMMKQVTSKMRLINETSNRMSDIIDLIDAIAFQTNILALNAAVEAARAGEHGRGFAVVAGEVRQLAQKSASSASEIRELIESSTSQTQDGMNLVEKASALINGMVGNVEEMDVILREIRQASHEQTEGISQINSAIGLIDATTQQNSALVEESVAAAASLNEQAMHLKELVRVFRVSEHAPA
ncbi:MULTISPECIES: methyl-accepting chemotaxis protein [Enterobacter]|jgi:methyl-accepting chemotaxis protein-2 (aspartate sensor receptor)|uniref:methyl-accepting chemotaxis protein n=1 Tax=Enterobacter TaxID=547 RepID=UPI00064D5C63|nr:MULTISPECIES: methyl-accepting chemotaxis protein [Enterobacter]KLW86669.1 methyl-accepting chemotaxis sensory transducer [Enterobacter sp. BIDMC92]MBO2914883.1 MCP four helix bundle domain-containing protein [Enterobacter sichuanensis]MBO2932595.1 MCP four helix bundle domain-containing protein [Enterobacter sichuanensis]MCA2028382.1 methyl-accepting chemotaxis protein [Enterobacter sp. K16B]MCM7885147.1 methyl-accepting chemotaxis protein [Enterobacter sichuanensis]